MGGMSNKWCNTAARSLDIMQNTGVKKDISFMGIVCPVIQYPLDDLTQNGHIFRFREYFSLKYGWGQFTPE